MPTATLKIDNCKQCPHMKKITSTYTGDSFDMSDEDAVCTHPSLRGEIRGAHETLKGKVIWGSERWWKPAHTVVPKWCPLLKRK